MGLEADVRSLREQRIERDGEVVPPTFQGVSKDRIREVLRIIDRETNDIVDAVFALLDDQADSWFSKVKTTFKFTHGASTAHVGCHVGILQRNAGKLDREGRDYWLKPMWEIGAIEKCFVRTDVGEIIDGHPIAKSANSAYRLAADFVEILKDESDGWDERLKDWIAEDRTRQRLALQAEAEALSRTIVASTAS